MQRDEQNNISLMGGCNTHVVAALATLPLQHFYRVTTVNLVQKGFKFKYELF
jgi:hypothetical protein